MAKIRQSVVNICAVGLFGLCLPLLVLGAFELQENNGRLDEAIKRASVVAVRDELDTAKRALDRDLVFMTALGAFAILGSAVIIVVYYRLVSRPVGHYIRTLRTDEPVAGYPALSPEGVRELEDLAEAINARRAQRLRVMQARSDSEIKLRANLQLMPLAALEIDAANRVLDWNPAAEQMFGYTREEAIGRFIIDLIVPERLREEEASVIERIRRGEVLNKYISANMREDGREIVCEWYSTPLYDSQGTYVGWASIVKDITEQQAEAEKILYLSRHDPLTGLLNRRSMLERMEEERQRSNRTGKNCSTIMLDIDKFKDFNDCYGHECGDLILRGVAQAMVTAVRSTDAVGRWGGEEFLILLPDTEREGGIELAEKIRRRIEETVVTYGENSLRVTLTAGVAACRGDEEMFDDCIRRADAALLVGKARGRNRVEGEK
jgi:diguanylate cyclase (GGDEF)-like protein/PAS domain S-box-containing protein